MNRFRIFLVPAILLAMATAVHAQVSEPLPPPAVQPETGCPAACWYFQAYQDSAAALQTAPRHVCSGPIWVVLRSQGGCWRRQGL